MNAVRAAVAPRRGAVGDLTLHRMQRALRERVRYRYVQPVVSREGDCFRIQSPCCSRNVDPGGGVIDIALLIPNGPNHWTLCARDHANQAWVARLRGQPLDVLLEALCVDDARQFWP